MGIPLNALPQSIRDSQLFSAADLDRLASIDQIPVIDPAYYDDRLKNIFQYYAINPHELEYELHCYAKELLAANKITGAWQVMLSVIE